MEASVQPTESQQMLLAGHSTQAWLCILGACRRTRAIAGDRGVRKMPRASQHFKWEECKEIGDRMTGRKGLTLGGQHTTMLIRKLVVNSG